MSRVLKWPGSLHSGAVHVAYSENAGAFWRGSPPSTRITHHRSAENRRSAISFVLPAAFATATTFWFLDSFWQIFVLIPIMGVALAAMLFSELFSELTARGTSFCYNVGRLVWRSADKPSCLPARSLGISRSDAVAAGRGRHVLGVSPGLARSFPRR